MNFAIAIVLLHAKNFRCMFIITKTESSLLPAIKAREEASKAFRLTLEAKNEPFLKTSDRGEGEETKQRLKSNKVSRIKVHFRFTSGLLPTYFR